MNYDSRLEELLFELASESRLKILRELQNENLKMQEIARRLDITATEAFRQLERLSTASLVQRQPDGAFALAEYGKLALQLLYSLDFVTKYKEYFSTHDLTHLPAQFINRLGELSQADLDTDTIGILNRGEKALTQAKDYIWGIAEGIIPEHMNSVMNDQAKKGIELRFLIPDKRLSSEANRTEMPKNVKVRGLQEIPALIVLTEKAGLVCFRQLGGKIDYAGFFGSDPVFISWVKDLFLHYWEKAK